MPFPGRFRRAVDFLGRQSSGPRQGPRSISANTTPLSIPVLAALLLLPAFRSPAVAFSEEPAASSTPAGAGPLRVLKTNPRYFTDGSGKAILLTGSHTWNSLQDYSYVTLPSP